MQSTAMRAGLIFYSYIKLASSHCHNIFWIIFTYHFNFAHRNINLLQFILGQHD